MSARKTKVFVLYYDFREEAGYRAPLFRALDSERIDATVGYLTGAPASPEQQPSKNFREYFFNFTTRALRSSRIGPLFKLIRFLRHKHFDVMVADRYKAGFILGLAQPWVKAGKTIAIFHVMDQFHRLSRRLFARLFLSPKWHVVGVSRAVASNLLDSKCGFSPDHVHAISNCIDVHEHLKCLCTKEQARKSLGLDCRDFVIGTIGRLVPTKGHHYLLSAFSKIKKDHIKLVIVGEGRERENLEKEVRKLNLTERVILTGNIENAFVMVPAFDLFALTSLKEAFGLVLLEAMAAKIPIITSDCGGTAEVVADLAPVFAPANVDALVSALNTMLEKSREEREAIGQALFQHLLRNYDIAAGARHYEEILTTFPDDTREQSQ